MKVKQFGGKSKGGGNEKFKINNSFKKSWLKKKDESAGQSNGYSHNLKHTKFDDDQQAGQNGIPVEKPKHKRFGAFPKKEFKPREQDENSGDGVQNADKKKKGGKKCNKGGLGGGGGGKLGLTPAVKHREGQKWYEYQVNELITSASDRLDVDKSKPIEEEADLLLRMDQDTYTRMMRTQGGSEAAWLETIIHKGTAGDKQTAMTLQTKNSPVHSISFIRAMVHTVERKNVREAMELIPLLTEVFIDELLPLDRKLISFTSRPLARLNDLTAHSQQTRKRLLVLWRFEHELKIVYERFTKALESLANGAIEKLCVTCLNSAQNLLNQRKEQENFLLSLLVNKLGHPNTKVAARAEYLLADLSRKQMNMRPVIVTEVERLIYRRNVSERAQHHAASFLSQLVLRAGENELAVQLLTIYFGLFKTLVAAKKTEHKLVGILLAGANRAFPYAKGKTDSLAEDMDSLYRLVHQAPFGVALQTLKLLHHVLNLNDSLSDRFYTSLYRKLFDHAPASAQHQLLDLLWKTLKADQVVARVRAFVKRLLQIATSESPPFAAGILILVSRLIETRPSLIVREREPQHSLIGLEGLSNKGKAGNEERNKMNEMAAMMTIDDDDDEEERYVDLDDDGVPLDRGVKKDQEEEDSSDDEVAEVSPVKGGKGGVPQDKNKGKSTVDDKKKIVKGALKPLDTKGWVHRKIQVHHGGVSLYDPTARNPLFISTDGTFDGELALLKSHYHPSIAVFAQTLLNCQTINYGADPLNDFTTIAFLDRFVFRNPKTTITTKSTVLASTKKGAVGAKSLSVSSQEYLSKRTEEIPADERFLHRFATLKFGSTVKTEKKKKKDEDDEEDWDDAGSVNSEEFEQVMARFEPGEANDEFDIDFGTEYSSEKQQKKSSKRKLSDDDEDEDGEDDEDLDMDDEDGDEDEDEDEGMDDDDEENEDEDEDEDEDDEDIEIEGEESDTDFAPVSRKGRRGESSDDDDEDYGDNDAFVSADRFAEQMEEFGEEESREARKDRMKRKTKKAAGRHSRK